MKKGALAFLIYCGITVALTYPLILQLGSVLPHDAGDPALNTWILWWNTQTLPFSPAWWNPPVFFPVPGVLTFSEHLLGLSLIATPLSWFGAGPQTAYNIVFLLTFPLSALGGYLLGYELTRRHDAAFIGGLLFGFAPYRIAHLPQLQGLASFPMPFALLGLHRYLNDPRPTWLALFAGGWLLQALCNGYYLLFFSAFVGLWILWFANPWSRPRQFMAIGMAWAVAAVLLLPLLLRYRSIHASFGFSRDLATIREFSADVASVLFATGHLKFWGWLEVFRRPEGELFPGLTVALLALAGAMFVRDRYVPPVPIDTWTRVRRVLVVLTIAAGAAAVSALIVGPWQLAPFGIQLVSVSTPMKPLTVTVLLALLLAATSPALRRTHAAASVLGFYAVAGFTMWLFSLGPTPTLMGGELMYRGPYALLMYLPGFSSLRAPARFWMVVTLCLAVVGTMVFARLTEKLGRLRWVAAAIVAAGILADTWLAAMPMAELPKPLTALECAGASSGPLLELPLGETYTDVAAMYRQMSHRRPIMNGYSGYFPPHYLPLGIGLRRREPDVISSIATLGITTILVNREIEHDAGWDAYLLSSPTVTHLCTKGKQSAYRLAAPTESPAASGGGTPLHPLEIRANVNPELIPRMIDGDLNTRWESGPQEPGMRVEVDLGSVRTFQRIELSLGPFVEDFPRELVVEVSEDGERWRELWRGGSAGRAVIAAVDPLRGAPVSYSFEPVLARLVRMRLEENDEKYYWSIAEIKLFGR